MRNLAQVREFANRPIVSALCPFRKYQDLPWAEVPADYIQWTLRNRDDLDADIRYTMEGELDRRATTAVEPSRHLNFGKAHKGKLMAAVPTDYLEWVLRENKDVSPADRLGIQLEMKNRANGHDGFVERLHTLLSAAPGFRAEADLLAKLMGPAENRCGIIARMLALDAPQWERLCTVIPNDVAAQLKLYAAPEPRRSSAPRTSRPRP
ncbi:hypothetical protein [Acidovorax carolinensis]|uniref:hypothetical protein n=1 Tax=Acidovorax carolinensis TaxID=553814 RepID=UPI0012FFAB8D|nr:hypothetical protein [Acidovorax carolinensis]